MKGFAGGNAASMAGLNVLSGYSPLKFEVWRRIIEDRNGEDEAAPGYSLENIASLLKPDYLVLAEETTIKGYSLETDAELRGIGAGGFLYRSKTVSPKYYFAREIISHDGLPAVEMLDLALSSSKKGVTHVLGDAKPGKRSTKGQITSINKLKQGYSLEGDFANGCFLVILDSWYPGWKALIDGEEAGLYLVDGLFRGVEVPGGPHKIEFLYKPKSFHRGIILSLIGFVLALILIALPLGRHASLVEQTE